MPSFLDHLGHKYGTDKASGSHNYLDFYDLFLHDWRTQPITLMEIGVGGGSSLRMWHEYFPNAKIIGFDIEDRSKEISQEYLDRITLEIGDQREDSRLLEVNAKHGPFDFILDDAGHWADAQISSHKLLAPLLQPGGFYILEDISSDDRVSDYLLSIAKDVINGREPNYSLYEFMAVYRETSVLKRRE